jgi:hypothetical protein
MDVARRHDTRDGREYARLGDERFITRDCGDSRGAPGACGLEMAAIGVKFRLAARPPRAEALESPNLSLVELAIRLGLIDTSLRLRERGAQVARA